jgi:hypothetical protein
MCHWLFKTIFTSSFRSGSLSREIVFANATLGNTAGLPTACPSIPATWSAEELALLAGSLRQEAASTQRTDILAE